MCYIKCKQCDALHNIRTDKKFLLVKVASGPGRFRTMMQNLGPNPQHETDNRKNKGIQCSLLLMLCTIQHGIRLRELSENFADTQDNLISLIKKLLHFIS